MRGVPLLATLPRQQDALPERHLGLVQPDEVDALDTLLLLGLNDEANEARELGLVNRVLPAGELDAFVRTQARKLTLLPPASLRATKRLMKEGAAPDIAARMSLEGKQFGEMLRAPEAREAFTAFFEKRRPDFSKFN